MSDTTKNSAVNADKIRKDIHDLKDKKQTLILSLQNDIDSINGNMKNEFCEIGEKAHGIYSSGDQSMTTLKAAFESIDQHLEDRNAKEKKIVEITERYDEEITLLEKLVPITDAAVAPDALSSAEKAFCSSCGTSYTTGEDAFCSNCGGKL